MTNVSAHGKFRFGTRLIVLLFGLAVLPVLAHAETFTGLNPASPQPDPANLKPGLAVTYYGVKVDSIRELEENMGYMDGKPGAPIPMLNYQVGAGNVLTSNSNDMVGAIIKGFIKMEQPGRYVFMVHSNDGVWIAIGDKLIYEDPDVHADRFSDEIVVEISEPGWYPIHIKYFEKKNTSTLELYWEAPGFGEMDYVPAEAFGHIGE
ncbi:PA14 domain-containing protein [uncultured Sneathiella sp.]|uniref:PA14 domain-containing protein n=1 Tax=uncultured Sneathiella sp. TaxID=879315 RepID=UPI002592EA0D|nr:PA14 domain-containing protein [uncultured Sneathiella sp.]